jgi:hypothetical protein
VIIDSYTVRAVATIAPAAVLIGEFLMGVDQVLMRYL